VNAHAISAIDVEPACAGGQALAKHGEAARRFGQSPFPPSAFMPECGMTVAGSSRNRPAARTSQAEAVTARSARVWAADAGDGADRIRLNQHADRCERELSAAVSASIARPARPAGTSASDAVES